MKAVIDRRETGIPGSNADEYVERMGGPVAQRASRKPGSGSAVINFRRDPSQDAIEEPLDDDVQPEGNDEHDEWEEWKSRRSSRTEVKRRLAEQPARSTPVPPERRPTGKPIPPRRTTDDLPRPQQRRHMPGRLLLLLGALSLMVLYLLIGMAYSAWIGVSNRLSYGPTPTSYLQAVVGDHDTPDHPTWVVAMNEHGTIIIQVAPGGDFSQAATYTVDAQTFHSWGNPDDVVITLTVAGTGPAPNILVNLEGDPDLSHFYQRPSVSFPLLNQRPGFKVGPVLS